MNVRCACGQDIVIADSHTNTCPACGALVTSAAEPSPTPKTVPCHSRRTRLSTAGLYLALLLFTVIAGWGIFTAAIFPAIYKAKNAYQLHACEANLLRIADALKYYRGEHGGLPPILPAVPGRLMFSRDTLDPDYKDSIGDYSTFACPAQEVPPTAHPEDLIDDESYFYLSHVLLNDEQGTAFAEVYRQRMHEGIPMWFMIDVPPGTGSNGQDSLKDTRVSIGRFLIEDIDNQAAAAQLESRIPIMVEWPSHHSEPGGHVLYFDGHVEFLKHPGPFPMTKQFIETMRQLDQLSPQVNTNQ